MQQRWQKNVIPILKTLFLQKQSEKELHKSSNYNRAAIVKLLINENITKRRKSCNDYKIWKSDNCKYVVCGQISCSSSCSQCQAGFMFGEHPRKPYNPECLVPSVKHGDGSVIIWAAISWYSAGQITASDYVDILGTHMHLMVQTLFPNNNAIFQEDICPYTQTHVFCLGFRNMKMHFNIFLGQHNCQT
jgi:hypothetical protein